MSDHLDKKLGADPNYRAARSETRRVLQELRARLGEEPEVWKLVLALETALQAQVATALDVGFEAGQLTRARPPEPGES